MISPSDACSCSFSVWINRVWDILNEYREEIQITSVTSDSEEAKELGQGGRTVVVNGTVTPVFLLENRLNELITPNQVD